jgi:hypothetical protein
MIADPHRGREPHGSLSPARPHDPCGQRRQFQPRPRRGAGDPRRERLRQNRQPARADAALARKLRDRGPHRDRRRGHHRRTASRLEELRGGPHRDDLSGAGDGARPGLHDRRADRRNHHPSRADDPSRGAAPRARPARAGADPVGQAPPRRLPARDVGRHAPARDDRAGAVVQAERAAWPTSRPRRST